MAIHNPMSATDGHNPVTIIDQFEGINEWGGSRPADVGDSSSTNTIMFPITLGSRDGVAPDLAELRAAIVGITAQLDADTGVNDTTYASGNDPAAMETKTLSTITDYWFTMPFCSPDADIGKHSQFRWEYDDQKTATHARIAVWDGVTGVLIESAQENITSPSISHVNLTGGWPKYVYIGVNSGIPSSGDGGISVDLVGGFSSNTTGLGMEASEASGKNVSAVLAVKGTGDWEDPPAQLLFDDAGLGNEGSIGMANSIAFPMFCAATEN